MVEPAGMFSVPAFTQQIASSASVGKKAPPVVRVNAAMLVDRGSVARRVMSPRRLYSKYSTSPAALVINVGSTFGAIGFPGFTAYSASKFGVRGISEVLRFDLARHGIHVGLVCPGAVDTPLVGTVDIVGIDRGNPEVQATVKRFQRHAVTPEKAAAAILRGIRAKRYMIFTSPDIRVGYWFQRKFALPYEIVMRALNDYLYAIARRQRRPSTPEQHT